jgi:hypothetical protein
MPPGIPMPPGVPFMPFGMPVGKGI